MASKTDKKWGFLLGAIVMVSSSLLVGCQASPIPDAERPLPGNVIIRVGSGNDPDVGLAVEGFLEDFEIFCLDRQGREQNMAANGFEQKSDGYWVSRFMIVNFGPSTSNSGGEFCLGTRLDPDGGWLELSGLSRAEFASQFRAEILYTLTRRYHGDPTVNFELRMGRLNPTFIVRTKDDQAIVLSGAILPPDPSLPNALGGLLIEFPAVD